MELLVVWLVSAAVGVMQTAASRYRSCQDGCCVHEYCAYHTICYPKIHCRFGCPDGHCVGQNNTSGVQKSPLVLFSRPGLQTAGDQRLDSSPRLSDIITERYTYNDRVRAMRADDPETKHSSSPTGEVKEDAPEGICMPLTPCKPNDYCGMAHSCTYNYNLGYNTCQYNLDIGSTLCVDSKGKPNRKPMN
ncbi:uncharacterized protein LOC131948193 [Physella acuta]|uniref:uncharacterized protein LOC131948193 n=1 Tax=Physella acuta TaxID=109671 RepID=UPI0027DB43A2|nr:uncharacterized protein LOC131948193 [Physella acuta]